MSPLLRVTLGAKLLLLALACGGMGLDGTAPPAGVAIHPDTVTEGRLGPTSPRSFRDGVPVAFYELQAPEGVPVEIRARSEDLDTHLSLFTPGGEFLGANDDSHLGLDALLQVMPQGEPLRVVVSANRPEDQGSFRLEVETLGDIQPPGVLAPPASLTGFVHRGSPRLPGDYRPAVVHPLRIDEPTTVVATLDTESVDLRLMLRGGAIHLEDHTRWRQGASVVSHLQPGTYEVVVGPTERRGADGRYHLKIEAVHVDAPGALPLPGSVTGFLQEGARDTWTLQVPTRQHVTIDLGSTQFDTWLELRDARGRLIDENDDIDFGTDSRLALELDPGRYQVVARGYSESLTGLYTLATRVFEVREPEPLRVPGEVTATLTEGPLNPLRSTFEQRYSFTLGAATSLQIDLTSEDFDAWLQLYDGQGQLVDENDDYGDGTDSRLYVDLRPGAYQLVVTTYAEGETGIFRLTAARR